MNILISAIIPVYNSAEFLEECIESLRNQTLKEIEMIFINDGSTDNSLDILKKYSKIDNRIKIIEQVNSGPSAARNKGIEIAKGEYISFIDSDDWIDDQMYESMYNMAKNHKSDSVICDMKMVSNKEELYIKGLTYDCKQYNRKDIENKIFKELLSNSQFNSMANKIFRRKIVKESNLILDEEVFYAEDWLFNMEFFKKCNKVSYINKSYYNYRRGHESSSSSYKENTFEKVGLWVYNMRKKYANELGINLYLGVDDLFKVIIHCIVSEFRQEHITLKNKFNQVKYIITSNECKEVIKYIDLNKLTNKERVLYYFIKFKQSNLLYLYVILGKLKENKKIIVGE